ncbi:MAG: rRNA maturation RNase YbeY [Bacteroidia bacterium]|nr:rRNA maturation RNase YbeY [Bacteroidia bacterium]
MIRFYQKETKFNLQYKAIVKKWIKGVVEASGKRVGDINIIFCDDESLLEINKQFLNHNYYTDIITFDYCEGVTISGELYISVDTVEANAKEYEVSFRDEMHRVIIHGILHLIGFDDHSEQQTAQMREQEDLALDQLSLVL